MANDQACVLCNSSVDNAIELGEKYTYKNVTAHYFCLVSDKISKFFEFQ